jgi:hypothetical protein
MDIFKKLEDLNFPFGHYVVAGSGIMAVLGLREARDIDVAVDEVLLEKLKKDASYKREIRYGKLFLIKDDVEIITQLDWEDYPTKVSEAIRTAEIIKGYPFLNLEEIIKFKKALGRGKDKSDIKLIENYLLRIN